ncbi:MAG: redox-regulated ATPase YchF [Eubacteriales bacterium]|nr:redox-regulated ATPase YchF [Eubacteriales bacterium]
MKVGIVGLPNVGKSTLFNAITHAGAEAANYPFCTIEPNHGVVPVPDKRLNRLAEISDSKKIVPAVVEFVDIAGLVAGASRGEGLGNKFLANIRETDAILHVVRCFKDPDVTHVSGNSTPVDDATVINLELILSDLEFLERRIDKVERMAKSGDKKIKEELAFLERLQAHLADEQPARTFSWTEEERLEYSKDLPLLTNKPVLYVANISEDAIGQNSPELEALSVEAKSEEAAIIPISAQIEEEISLLDDPEERAMFLEDLGLDEPGLDKIIRASYDLLGLMSFLTTGPEESRAWTIRQGTKAAEAAGKIHSDIERGFIRAEIVSYDVLDKLGSMKEVRDQGFLRSEGRDYVMQDGDVVLFRFNV